MEMVVGMADKFLKPDFSSGDIELRVEDGEVCIYATDEGLDRIAAFRNTLKKSELNDHCHLEDYSVLTERSLKGVIAKFAKSK